MDGMAGGVAFIPAVPGLAPGAFMWERVKGRGCPCSLAGLASEREGRIAIPFSTACGIKAPCASWGTVTWCTN